MNESNVPTVPSEGSTLPSQAASRKSDLVPETGRAGSNEYIGVYQHTPPVFGFTLGDILEVLKRRRRFLIIGAVIGAQLAVLVLYLSTPLYSVSAQVVITQQVPGQLIDSDSGSSAFIATQAEVLQSLTVVQQAVATLPRPNYLEPEIDAVAAALETVHASAIAGTRVIALAYLGPDPKYGAALLNAMVDAYLTQVRDGTSVGQATLRDTKSAELEVLLEEVARQESKIDDLRQKNAIVGTAEEAAAAQAARLSDQVAELMKARNRRVELQSRFAAGGATATADDRFRTSLRDDLRKAESELANARKTLTAEHPATVAAERNVDVLRAQLASSEVGSRDDLRQQVGEAVRLETELAAMEAKSRERLKDIETYRRKDDKLEVELERLQSHVSELQRELLEQRLASRLAVAGGMGIGAHIIANPVLPDEPIWPKKKFILLSGTVLGLVVGFVFALVSLRRQRDPGVVEW